MRVFHEFIFVKHRIVCQKKTKNRFSLDGGGGGGCGSVWWMSSGCGFVVFSSGIYNRFVMSAQLKSMTIARMVGAL